MTSLRGLSGALLAIALAGCGRSLTVADYSTGLNVSLRAGATKAAANDVRRECRENDAVESTWLLHSKKTHMRLGPQRQKISEWRIEVELRQDADSPAGQRV